MNINHILIVMTEPKSIFFEILLKYFRSKSFKRNKKKISIVGNISLINKEIKKNKYKIKINEILDIRNSKNNFINLINIKINKNHRNNNHINYISDCFSKSLSILKKNKNVALLNGPINKKTFLKKNYLGITEYLAKKTNSKNPVMLIYNKKLSVSPITTHLPIKYVSKNINKSKIIKKVKSINSFFIKNINKKPKIAVLGLNPALGSC